MIKDSVIQIQGRSISDPTLSDVDLQNSVPRESFSSIISKGDMTFFSPEVLPGVNWKFQCVDMVSKPLILHGWTHNFY